MKKLQMTGLALVAMFAFSAVLAATASAETTLLAEWTVNGTAIAAGAKVAAEIKGKILLEDNKVPILGKVAVACEGILDGELFENGRGQINAVLNAAGTETVETGLGTKLHLTCENQEKCTKPGEVWLASNAANVLPWPFKVFLMENGEFLLLIEKAGYEVQCDTALGTQSDECTSADSESAIGIPGGVATIPAGATATPNGTCTVGGAGSGVNTAINAAPITSGASTISIISE